jgi:hypothetical protein
MEELDISVSDISSIFDCSNTDENITIGKMKLSKYERIGNSFFYYIDTKNIFLQNPIHVMKYCVIA